MPALAVKSFYVEEPAASNMLETDLWVQEALRKYFITVLKIPVQRVASALSCFGEHAQRFGSEADERGGHLADKLSR